MSCTSCAHRVPAQENCFPGLVPLIFAYLDEIACDPETLALVSSYMELILRRAKGMHHPHIALQA